MKYDEIDRLAVQMRETRPNNAIIGLSNKRFGEPDVLPVRDPKSDAVFVQETYMIVESKMNR